MIRKIIIIAKDRKVFLQIKEACGQSCGNNYVFIFAQNIQTAVDLLRERNVALVLLGRLPQEKRTLSLLSYIYKYFPDIAVLNMAGNRESLESMIVDDDGITVQSVKMLPDKNWPEVINNTLRMEQQGGSLTISDVSLFVQMVQQEQRTCTLRVFNDINCRIGILFFQKGELKNARLKTVQGKAAACEMLTWEAVRIDIQDTCDFLVPRIDTNLQAILIEGSLKKNNSDKCDTTSSWVAAAKEEEQDYRKLLSQVRDDQISDKKGKSALLSRPAKATPFRIFRRSILMTAAIVLVLLAVAAYMANRYLNNAVLENSWFGEKSMAPPPLPQSVKSPPNVSSPEQSTETSQSTQTPPNKIQMEKDKPEIITSLKQYVPTTAAFETEQVSTPQPLTIFLHYTYSKNRSLANQLANHLSARGFFVQDVEQIKYYRNEIRYFHTVDREGAQTLHRRISAFLENSQPPNDASPFNLKNLADTYPQVPQGQIEIWLRLPST